METLFPLVVAALEVFNRYGLQDVRYTLYKVFDKDVLERLRKMVIYVRPDIAEKGMLHHDNAPCHTVLSVTEFFFSKVIPVVLQPLYSPDLCLCDFYVFSKLKNVLKERHFGTLGNIQKNVTDIL
jgi:hypothetical protein